MQYASMTPTKLREKMADPRMNLSALERLSGVPLRTLRRIKNGTSDVRPETVERIAGHLKKACAS
jgi:hypothetical protein